MHKFLLSAAIIGILAGSGAAIAQDREHQDQGRHEERGRQGEAPGRPFRDENRRGGPGNEFRGQERGAPPAPNNAPREGGGNESRNQERSAPSAPNNAFRGGGGNEFRGQEQRAAPDNAMRERGGNEFRGQEQRAAPDNAMRERGGNEFRGQDRFAPAPNNAMRGARPEFNGRGERGRRDFGSVRNFHRNFNAPRHFRAGRYRAPPGYFARRWSWGEFLPPAFWARDYWILDFGDYDLPPPPFGAVWVRVGDDALLIDQLSGEIIEVDYGVFY